jgi:hypothetical protein
MNLGAMHGEGLPERTPQLYEWFFLVVSSSIHSSADVTSECCASDRPEALRLSLSDAYHIVLTILPKPRLSFPEEAGGGPTLWPICSRASSPLPPPLLPPPPPHFYPRDLHLRFAIRCVMFSDIAQVEVRC